MQGSSKLFTVFCFGLIWCYGYGQQSVEQFAKSSDMAGALTSVVLADLETGDILESANADQRLCPASVWKIFTTSAAISILGPDFRFRTLLARQGHIENGVLDGNLYLIGGGDPSLGSKYFEPGLGSFLDACVSAVKAAGIDSITGKVVANASHFSDDGLPRTRIWEDMGNYYGGAVSGLNIFDNSYVVTFDVPAEPGMPARIVSVSPEVPGLSISSEVLSSTRNSDQAFIFGSPFDSRRVVRGTLPVNHPDYTIRGSLPNPPLFAAYHLQKHLLKSGVGTGQGIAVELTTTHEKATLKTLYSFESPPLSELVKHTNVMSDNLYAEAILFQLGARNGDPSNAGGIRALEAFYKPVCMDKYPFYAYDGSGLSRFGAVSARQVVEVLVFDASHPTLRSTILQTLPQAGKEGSMRWFGRRTNLEGNLRAKSGSMEGVKAYAGVLTAFSGRQLAFAVLVNNYDGTPHQLTQRIEELLLRIYGDY